MRTWTATTTAAAHPEAVLDVLTDPGRRRPLGAGPLRRRRARRRPPARRQPRPRVAAGSPAAASASTCASTRPTSAARAQRRRPGRVRRRLRASRAACGGSEVQASVVRPLRRRDHRPPAGRGHGRPALRRRPPGRARAHRPRSRRVTPDLRHELPSQGIPRTARVSAIAPVATAAVARHRRHPPLRRGRVGRRRPPRRHRSRSPPASSRPSWARRAPASRRSCTCSPGSTRPTSGTVAHRRRGHHRA